MLTEQAQRDHDAHQRLDAIRALLATLPPAFHSKPGAEAGAVMFLAQQYVVVREELDRIEKEQAQEEAEAFEYRGRT